MKHSFCLIDRFIAVFQFLGGGRGVVDASLIQQAICRQFGFFLEQFFAKIPPAITDRETGFTHEEATVQNRSHGLNVWPAPRVPTTPNQ